ncbi:AAA-domain-containing protein [Suillus paluster]|uniref:AAA-domain-containing protein n=1 Tax=Suillus paluster TaxID=48578 RepID=UPI001B86EBF6|nr:AAA-domain-containing protein [Suillus paluster]KAG1727061.1 AAA-domain-containing protein [Suillus paluster]
MSSSLSTRRLIILDAVYCAIRVRLRHENTQEAQRSDDRSTKSAEAIKKLIGQKNLKLDEYERAISKEVVHPDEITVRFQDIGGLEPIVSSLRETIIYPLIHPTLFTSASPLLGAPKGVLLYGPPGCGKTMLARALAKESGATFINVPASTLTNKWFGESNKLVAGLFSLARKVQPAIIFVDEIDSFLRERRGDDHEVMGMMKAEFMTSWDGLTSGSDRILVLGATNRPGDIDPAILRRMPKRFAVNLPDAEQRFKILSLMLKDTKLDPHLSLRTLASQTTGFSGSDLRELCRNAAMVPVRECMRAMEHDEEALMKVEREGFNMRPLTLADFYEAEGSTLQPPDPDDEPISLQAFIDTHPELSPQTESDPTRTDALVVEEVSEYDSDNDSRFQTDESMTLDGDDPSTLKDESSDDL